MKYQTVIQARLQLQERKIPIAGCLYSAGIQFEHENGRERVLAITMKAAAVEAKKNDECVIIDSSSGSGEQQREQRRCESVTPVDFKWETLLNSSDDEFDSVMQDIRLNYARTDITSDLPPRVIVRVGKSEEKIIRNAETAITTYMKRNRTKDWKKRAEM